MFKSLIGLLLPVLALGFNSTHNASDFTIMEPQFFLSEGSKRVQIPYGPYTVPARSDMDGMKDFTEAPAQAPCTDCLITWMQADLHYVNGTQANANTGLWLHHTVLADTAGEDLFCAGGPQRFFASGNERTVMNICVNGTNRAGYYVGSNASWGMTSELMNMVDQANEAIVTITYEYIPSPDASFAHVQLLWLDIGPGGGCLGSDRPAYANSTFNYSSPNWMATSNGRVTYMGSHLHDGGSHVDIKLNDNVVCNSVASYGQTPAYIETMPMNMSMGGTTMEMNMTTEHISSISTCADQGAFKPGDNWSITAYYDTNEYMPMQNTDGSLEEIMGISLVYFVEGDYVNATNGSHILLDDSSKVQNVTQSNGGTRVASVATGSIWVGVFTVLLAVVLNGEQHRIVFGF